MSASLLILPCPVCGGDADVRARYIGEMRIECKGCGARTAESSEFDALVAAWNVRSAICSCGDVACGKREPEDLS